MPKLVASPYGQWPEQATRELQLGFTPPDLQHALDSGTKEGVPDPQLRWALSVRLTQIPRPAKSLNSRARAVMLAGSSLFTC